MNNAEATKTKSRTIIRIVREAMAVILSAHFTLLLGNIDFCMTGYKFILSNV